VATASSPLEALRHEQARRAALAIAAMLTSILRPDEQRLLASQAFDVIRASIDAYEAERARVN
jgi:hypothetical protein